jgi:hypothetical protein
MFDGTELSLAYGDNMLEPPQNQVFEPSFANQSVPKKQHQDPNLLLQAQIPPDTPYNIPEAIYTEQQSKSREYKGSRHNESSFWDKLMLKKNDVFKLIIFSLVILLAISFDKFFFHYLKNYIDENILTFYNELLIRLIYPISIIIIIWLSKAI